MNPDDVDPAALTRIRDLGGAELVAKMLTLFDSYVGAKVAEACAAAGQGDLATVQGAAHPVKSSAGHMGAHRVRDLALRMEQLADAGQPIELPELARQLEVAFREARAELTRQAQAMGVATPGLPPA